MDNILDVVFKSVERVSNLLGLGNHAVTIESIEPTVAKSDDWSDLTPQLAIKFKAEDGKSFTGYYNMAGFKRYEELTDKEQKSGKFDVAGEEGYAVDAKTKERVRDEDRTEQSMSIIGNVACDAGIEAGKEFGLADLQGTELGIYIENNDRDNPRIKYTMPLDKLPKKAAVAAE